MPSDLGRANVPLGASTWLSTRWAQLYRPVSRSQGTACVPCLVRAWCREHLPTVAIRHGHELDMVPGLAPSVQECHPSPGQSILLPPVTGQSPTSSRLLWVPHLPLSQDSPINASTSFRLQAPWMGFLVPVASGSQLCVSRSHY